MHLFLHRFSGTWVSANVGLDSMVWSVFSNQNDSAKGQPKAAPWSQPRETPWEVRRVDLQTLPSQKGAHPSVRWHSILPVCWGGDRPGPHSLPVEGVCTSQAWSPQPPPEQTAFEQRLEPGLAAVCPEFGDAGTLSEPDIQLLIHPLHLFWRKETGMSTSKTCWP